METYSVFISEGAMRIADRFFVLKYWIETLLLELERFVAQVPRRPSCSAFPVPLEPYSPGHT